MKLYIWISSLVIAFSFITRPIIINRITPGDLLGAVCIFLFLLIATNKKIFFPQIAWSSLGLILSFLPGIAVSQNKGSTFEEITIIVFLFTLYISLINVYKSTKRLKYILLLCVGTFITACVIGFWDLAGDFSSLPRVFSRRYIAKHGYEVFGELVSGFRNSGQAGAYMLVAFAIVYPLSSSKISILFSAKQKRYIKASIYLIMIFLLLSAKVAAYIGFIGGIILLVGFKRKFSIFKPILLISLGAFLLYGTLQTAAPKVVNRIVFKVRTRVLEKVIEDKSSNAQENNFLSENYGAAFEAFKDNPFLGSGLGGFYGIYYHHEVHSTPVKLMGETGLVGLIAYFLFMCTICFTFLKKGYSPENPYKDYLVNMMPLFFGAFISWGYTYHLRKREFWILLAVITIAQYLAQEYEKQKKLNLSLGNTNHLI